MTEGSKPKSKLHLSRSGLAMLIVMVVVAVCVVVFLYKKDGVKISCKNLPGFSTEQISQAISGPDLNKLKSISDLAQQEENDPENPNCRYLVLTYNIFSSQADKSSSMLEPLEKEKYSPSGTFGPEVPTIGEYKDMLNFQQDDKKPNAVFDLNSASEVVKDEDK